MTDATIAALIVGAPLILTALGNLYLTIRTGRRQEQKQAAVEQKLDANALKLEVVAKQGEETHRATNSIVELNRVAAELAGHRLGTDEERARARAAGEGPRNRRVEDTQAKYLEFLEMKVAQGEAAELLALAKAAAEQLLQEAATIARRRLDVVERGVASGPAEQAADLVINAKEKLGQQDRRATDVKINPETGKRIESPPFAPGWKKPPEP